MIRKHVVGEIIYMAAVKSSILILIFQASVAEVVDRERDRRFIGIGYNLLTGNPDGADVSLPRAGVDTGLLITRKILDVGDENAVITEERDARSKIKTTYAFVAGKSYQNHIKSAITFDVGWKLPIVNFAFSASPMFNRISKQKRMIFRDEEELANLGSKRYASEAVNHYQLSVTKNFALALCQLRDPGTKKEDYMKFFDAWGTHIVMRINFGYRKLSRNRIALATFFKSMSKNSAGGIELIKAPGVNVGVRIEASANSTISASSFGSKYTEVTVGTEKDPEPIHLNLVPIYMALDAKHWTDNDLCNPSITEVKLNELAETMKRELDNYPAHLKAQEPEELKIPLVWPQGQYGMYKTKEGCPSGGNNRWFFTEITQSVWSLRKSAKLHLRGEFNSQELVTISYCLKSSSFHLDGSAEVDALPWPPGKYCIIKMNGVNCPGGFEEGFLQWDDRDKNNANRKVGLHFPSGVFNKNTRIDYCCRQDGPLTRRIILPTEKAFYLLRYDKHSCQEVQGMVYDSEYIMLGEERDLLWFNSKHEKGGSHPYVEDSEGKFKLHLCYYRNPTSTE